MANMTADNGVFQLPITIDKNGTVTKVLQTEGTYVDKNIKLEITTPDATFEQKDKGAGANGEITAKVSTTDTIYTSDTESPYAITIAADAHVNALTVGTKDAGFTATTDETTIAASDAAQVTKTLYIKEGTLSGEGTASATSDVISLTKVAEAPTDGSFYIKASGSGEVGVATAGWVDPTKTAKVTTGGDAYYTVKAASLANTGNEAATELTTPILTEDGYLFINEGYIKDTKISLATLVPDDATLAGTDGKSPLMYKTVSAYDKDGKLIAGTMDDAALTGAIDEILVNNNLADSSLKINNYGGVLVASLPVKTKTFYTIKAEKEGYLKADTSKQITTDWETTANVSFNVSKIGLGATVDTESVNITPVVGKSDATTAKSGEITTTAPTAGHYIAVETNAVDNTITVTPTVTTEGYGLTTTGGYTATSKTIDVDVNASGTYYVPIEAGSHTITENASNITAATATVTTEVKASDDRTIAGVLAAAPTSGAYLTINGTAATTEGSVQTSSTCTVTEGYVTAEAKTTAITETVAVTATDSAPKYIKIYDGALLDA